MTFTPARRVASLSVIVLAVGVLLVVFMRGALASSQEPAVAIPAPALDPAAAAAGDQTAVLAGGCFWGVQGVFEHVTGVRLVIAGYSGGAKTNPSYEDVSTERTGHAESVKVTYDPARVSYGKLLQVFFSVAHNPTELNRQGPDTGPSYRSNIFYTTPEQKTVADAYIAQLTKAGSFARPIVTRVDAFGAFYPAEDYHQDFLIKNPTHPYIVVNDLPKIANFKRLLPTLYSEKAVMASGKSRG